MVRPRRAGATARFIHSVTPIILWLMRLAGCGPWFVDEAGLDYPAIHPARPFPIPLLLNAAVRRHSAIQQTRLPSWPRRRVRGDGRLRYVGSNVVSNALSTRLPCGRKDSGYARPSPVCEFRLFWPLPLCCAAACLNTPKSVEGLPSVYRSGPSTPSPRLRSSRIAAARLGIR